MRQPVTPTHRSDWVCAWTSSMFHLACLHSFLYLQGSTAVQGPMLAKVTAREATVTGLGESHLTPACIAIAHPKHSAPTWIEACIRL